MQAGEVAIQFLDAGHEIGIEWCNLDACVTKP
jgi:hypothetical protein